MRQTSNITSGNKTRISYLDFLKALMIIGMVELHASGHDAKWWNPDSINTIFFFISGIFFSSKSDFKDFAVKKIRTILIPFLWFYILSYPIHLMIYLWDYRSLSMLPYGSIFDLFEINSRADYLSVNVPLWFLLCLFVCELIYYPISKLPKWAVASILTVIAIFGQWIYSIPTPFMINNAIFWLIFFGCGNLCGKSMISVFKNRQSAWIFSCISLVVGIALYFLLATENDAPITRTNAVLIYLPYCFAFSGFASLVPGGRFYNWIVSEYGKNTLLVLCMHRWIEIPVCRISYLLTRTYSPWLAILSAVITLLILIPLIKLVNSKFPFLIGKGLK